jgi:uncharacterized membrane protein YoaT (DUF817 family)
MIPERFAPIIFGFILSGLMSFVVSGISTFRSAGFVPELPAAWTGAWLTSWLFAFPIVIVIAPLARRAVDLLVRKD